jgi:hypothetical protein
VRTARIVLSQKLFFNQMGLKNFRGEISGVGLLNSGDSIELFMKGEDERLPDNENYPKCIIIERHVDSSILEYKE